MFDMSEIFDDGELTQIAKRYPAEIGFDDGDLVEVLGDGVDITAIIHPTKPDDLRLLPEGERYLPSIKVMSLDEFKAGDQLDYKGERWRVSALGDWGDYGFYNGIAVKHEGTQAATSGAFELKGRAS